MRHGILGVVAACAPMLEKLDRDITIQSAPRTARGSSWANPWQHPTWRNACGPCFGGWTTREPCSGSVPSSPFPSRCSLCGCRRCANLTSGSRPRCSGCFWGAVPFRPLTDEPAPNNRAVLVDRHLATVVHEQDKLYPFTITPDQIADWGLSRIVSGRADEFMTCGERLSIRETAWGRFAVVICEDLAKLLETKVGRLVKDFGVSLLIAPVFSKEVQPYYWEHQQARTYSDHVGTRTLVANSLVIPRAVGKRGDVGTCLVNAPGGFELGRCRDPDQISVFWLTAQQVEVPATHPVATDPP